MDKIFVDFVWDTEKELINIAKHEVDFFTACKVFKDSKRKIFIDSKHSQEEKRFFCMGKVRNKILTVRFVCRDKKIRILGAGYWRKGVRYYEKNDERSK